MRVGEARKTSETICAKCVTSMIRGVFKINYHLFKWLSTRFTKSYNPTRTTGSSRGWGCKGENLKILVVPQTVHWLAKSLPGWLLRLSFPNDRKAILSLSSHNCEENKGSAIRNIPAFTDSFSEPSHYIMKTPRSIRQGLIHSNCSLQQVQSLFIQ